MDITINFDFTSNQYVFWKRNDPKFVGANAFALVFPGDEGNEHYERCGEVGLRIYNAMNKTIRNGGNASFTVSTEEYSAMTRASENSPLKITDGTNLQEGKVYGYLNFPPYSG